MTKSSILFLLSILCVFIVSSPLHAETASTDNSKPLEQPETKKDDDKPNKAPDSDSKKGDDDKPNKAPDSDSKKEEDAKPKKEEPPKIGNFSLPTSQQPAALFGFGGNIIDAGEVQIYFFADEFVGKKKILTDVIPNVLFGITDEWSVQFNFPSSPIMKDGCQRSSGFEDFFIQFEYAFYNKSTTKYVDQATLVGNITAPTGSIRKNPPTGFGAPSFFIGGTYYRTWVDWFVFVAEGAVLTTNDHGYKAGDQFLYQFGVGRNFPSPKGSIYAWMIEIDGQYNKKNRVHHLIDHNSGGNVIYVTPSLWVSTKEVLVQFGVSLPINQNLFGKQRKFDYALNLNCSWSFY